MLAVAALTGATLEAADAGGSVMVVVLVTVMAVVLVTVMAAPEGAALAEVGFTVVVDVT